MVCYRRPDDTGRAGARPYRYGNPTRSPASKRVSKSNAVLLDRGQRDLAPRSSCTKTFEREDEHEHEKKDAEGHKRPTCEREFAW